MSWQPDGFTIHAKKWLLGAGFLGAPPIRMLLITCIIVIITITIAITITITITMVQRYLGRWARLEFLAKPGSAVKLSYGQFSN